MVPDHAAIRLVVNADDFGATPAVSQGILQAHREGIVTSTSIIGNCADPAGVKALLDEAPGLGVGVHLTLVGGPCVAQPSAARSLVGPDGVFPDQPGEVLLSWAKGAMRADDVEREFEAQVARLHDCGLRIDHLDTGYHLGFLPAIGRAVEAVARHHAIPGIRMAIEKPSLAWVVEAQRGAMGVALGGLAWLTRRKLGTLRHGPRTWGFIESGRLDEVRILEIVGRLDPGIHELVCHPALPDGPPPPKGARDPARELRALTSPLVREAIAHKGVTLCRWADLF
ncbi:MAG TPA: ChbG/HpnK family deacetylase [Polyangia bacterium]|nr:ChbG/HpnK family deacetylase [Polyangia bacterium]